jgi:DNA-binding transcriptional regulator/RsmH inhibitor MraZ
MTRGRPPSWNLFANIFDGAWTEVVGVTTKDRLTLPAQVRKALGWFDASAEGGLLATLEPYGRAELIAWSDHGSRLIAEVIDRVRAAPAEARGDLAVAAMDRYMRLAVEPPARVALNATLAAHLDPTGRNVIRVVVSGGRLWLWNEAEWQGRRSERHASLDAC